MTKSGHSTIPPHQNWNSSDFNCFGKATAILIWVKDCWGQSNDYPCFLTEP